MKAVVVNSFDEIPTFQDFREPEARAGEVILTVNAAALSPIVKALASGKHYASDGRVGFVPGVDGIGTDSDGRRFYFLFPVAPFGSMAQISLAARAMTVPVPEAVSSVQAAAVVTGALASWIAYSRRARLQIGETVLIIGATGASGSMAVQTAKHFGAGKVIAVGRNEAKLGRLEADVKITLDDNADEQLREQFDQGVDVVLDFLWGEPASRVLTAATKDRPSRLGQARIRYVQLGTMAGDEIALGGNILRGSGLELMGSGIGSVAVTELLAGAGELLSATHAAGFDTNYESLPLSCFQEAWGGNPDVRYILMPDQ